MKRIIILFVLAFASPLWSFTDIPSLEWTVYCANNWLQTVEVDMYIPKVCDPNQPPPNLRYSSNWEKITFSIFVDLQMLMIPSECPEVQYWRQIARSRLHPDVRGVYVVILVLHWKPVCGCYTRMYDTDE